ncbi:MAG: hypothetical protein CLLPBCKN_004508 [Chroococcidiopsis cubana SAG 39.79]|nr:thiamine pyrophosphate-binding protein [Chroococcidiopsis cubana]MDZ4875112.1 hypothetical protein [Chroococcidiopsis cubana SAG 39.79]
MNTAELLVQCLEKNEAWNTCLVYQGKNLHVLEALKKSSIQFITTVTQGAAFMADVYGRRRESWSMPLLGQGQLI